MKTLTRKQEQILESLLKRNKDMLDMYWGDKKIEAKKNGLFFNNYGKKYMIVLRSTLKDSYIAEC